MTAAMRHQSTNEYLTKPAEYFQNPRTDILPLLPNSLPLQFRMNSREPTAPVVNAVTLVIQSIQLNEMLFDTPGAKPLQQ